VKTIFVVDDNRTNLIVSEEALSEHYEVITMLSGALVFELLNDVVPDLILLDILMPEMDGFAVLKKLKGDDRYADIPVIFLTSKNDIDTEVLGFEMGVVDFIIKPFSKPVLLNRIKNILHMESVIRKRTINLQERTEQLLRLQNSMAYVLANMVENRDKLTGEHIERTTCYIKILLESMNECNVYVNEIKDWNIDVISSTARLHDLGKIGIADSIINKPGKLTGEEYEHVKTHTHIGERIIDQIANQAGDDVFLLNARVFAGTHHEKWDGTGYPRGLKEMSIPLQGRIMAIVDVYDALVSDRPYRKAMTHEEAVEIIRVNSGTHFDPYIVDAFLLCKDKFQKAVGKETSGGKN